MVKLSINIHEEHAEWIREMQKHYETSATEVVAWALEVARWAESIRRKKRASIATVQQVGGWLTGRITTSTWKIASPAKATRDTPPKPPKLYIVKDDDEL